MVYRLLLLTALVSGCAAKEPAKSAASAETPSAETPSPKTETRPDVAPAPASKQEGSTAPASHASPEDLRDVLQAVIDDEALTPYLRLQQPNRFPLRISGANLPKDLQLTKATKAVVIVDDPGRDPKKPVLVITDIDIKGTEATVHYKYDVEGVRGFATLNKPYGRWSIKQSRVAGH